MNSLSRTPLLIIFTLFIACTSEPLQISGFDSIAWKTDNDGCRHIREDLIKQLIPHKKELIDKTEDEIISILGKPDKNELYTRSQKFFIYSINPNENCEKYLKEKGYLQIRFNAIGKSNEVLLVDFNNK